MLDWVGTGKSEWKSVLNYILIFISLAKATKLKCYEDEKGEHVYTPKKVTTLVK